MDWKYKKSFIFMYVLVILSFSMIGYARYARGAMTGVTNYALDQPTETSSVEKDQVDTWAGKFAVDGDRKTRWSSYFSDNQWLQVDLGEKKYVGGVNIYWENPAKDFKVQRSNDGNSWVNIKTITGNIEKAHNLLWSAQYARYIRIQCDVRSNEHGFSIYELEVNPPTHNMKIGVRWDANETPADCEGLDSEDCYARWEKLNFYLKVGDQPLDPDEDPPIHVLSQSYENGKSTPTITEFNVDFDKYAKTPIQVIVRSAAVIAGEEVESIDSDPGEYLVDLQRPAKLEEPLRVGENDEGKLIFEWVLHDDPRVYQYMISVSDEAGTGYRELLRRTHESELGNIPEGIGNAFIDRETVFTEPNQTKHFTIVSITSEKFGSIHSRWAPDAEYTWMGESVTKQVMPVEGLIINIQ